MEVVQTLEAIRAVDLEGVKSINVKVDDLVDLANYVVSLEAAIKVAEREVDKAVTKMNVVMVQSLQMPKQLDEYV